MKCLKTQKLIGDTFESKGSYMKELHQLRRNQVKTICPKFEQTFKILGKKWTGLIIDVLLEGPCRFKDLVQSIDGVSDRVLIERLKELEAYNIVTRDLGENSNIRTGYQLTEKGKDLEGVMDQIQTWADRWICQEDIQKNI